MAFSLIAASLFIGESPGLEFRLQAVRGGRVNAELRTNRFIRQ